MVMAEYKAPQLKYFVKWQGEIFKIISALLHENL